MNNTQRLGQNDTKTKQKIEKEEKNIEKDQGKLLQKFRCLTQGFHSIFFVFVKMKRFKESLMTLFIDCCTLEKMFPVQTHNVKFSFHFPSFYNFPKCSSGRSCSNC